LVQGGRLVFHKLSSPSNILFADSLKSTLLSVSTVYILSSEENVYRIYSTRHLDSKDLETLFGPENTAKIVHTSQERTCPTLIPFSSSKPASKIEIGKNIFVTHSIESIVSALETKLISSYNLANLISKRVSQSTSQSRDESTLLNQLIQDLFSQESHNLASPIGL